VSYPPSILTPSQLADLLNYVLGLPQRFGRNTRQGAIDRFIPVTWGAKTCGKVEFWAERELRKAGVLPELPMSKYPGRPCFPPQSLRRYVANSAEYWRWAG
jgi:hypothetical protein